MCRCGKMQEHRDSAERARFNKFKREFRKAHPTEKRNNKYYNTVRAAYKAQNTGSTLLPWLSVKMPSDAFMMDFENACLQQNWDSRSHPKGPRRFEDPQWAAMMRQQCEEHSDVTFEQYCAWCLAGGGDEWFEIQYDATWRYADRDVPAHVIHPRQLPYGKLCAGPYLAQYLDNVLDDFQAEMQYFDEPCPHELGDYWTFTNALTGERLGVEYELNIHSVIKAVFTLTGNVIYITIAEASAEEQEEMDVD